MRKILLLIAVACLTILLLVNYSNGKELLAYSEGVYTQSEDSSFKGLEIKLKGWASKLSGSTSCDPNDSYDPNDPGSKYGNNQKGTLFTNPTSFDLQDIYGFGGTKTSLQLEVKKDINERSFGYLAYFTDSRKSQVTLTSPVAFVWNKNTSGRPAGITFLRSGDNLVTSIKINSFDIGYGYYIGKKYQKGYIATLIGIRFNNLAVDWTYSGSISGSDLYRKRGASGFIGVEGNYTFSDNLAGFLRVDGGVTGVAGNRVGLFEYEIGTSVKFTNALHLELGYKYADIRAREDVDSKISVKLQGINGGLVFKF